jgi:hypothetical protein
MPSRVNGSLRRHPRTAPHRPLCTPQRLELGARRRCALRSAEARHVARSVACIKSSSARSEAALATAVALSSDACHCSHAKRVSASACSAAPRCDARTVAHSDGAVRGQPGSASHSARRCDGRVAGLRFTASPRGTHAARTRAARTHARGTHAGRHERGGGAAGQSGHSAPRAAPSLPPPPARRCRCRRPHAPPPPPVCRTPAHRRTPRGIANRPQQDKACALATSQQTNTQEAHRPTRPTAAAWGGDGAAGAAASNQRRLGCLGGLLRRSLGRAERLPTQCLLQLVLKHLRPSMRHGAPRAARVLEYPIGRAMHLVLDAQHVDGPLADQAHPTLDLPTARHAGYRAARDTVLRGVTMPRGIP